LSELSAARAESLWLRVGLIAAGVIAAVVAFLMFGPRADGAPDVTGIPAVQASLNSIAAALLVAAVVQVRRGDVDAHRKLALAAFAVSAFFLGAYLLYHAYTPEPRLYQGEWRGLYYALLITHIPLAAAVPVLALVTISRGWRGLVERHRPLARVTFTIWLYVSFSGVAIYAMLR